MSGRSTNPASTSSSTTPQSTSSRLSSMASRSSSSMIDSARSLSTCIFRPHSSHARPTKTIISSTTIGPRLMTKSLKVIPDRPAMMMLGGSPMSVAVPPMFEAIASASRNGTGEVPSRSQTSSVTGATSSTVVTLSSRAEATAVSTTSMTMTRKGRPRARFADQIAMNSNTPVCLTMPTMIIIPSSRKMTFQSIPVSSEKKALSALTAPSTTIAPAPHRAAATRWIRSVAMST